MKEVVDLLIGTGAGVLSAIVLRYLGHVADFVPRRLDSISTGTSFEAFHARGPGDNYDHVLWIRIRNNGGKPLYVVRAVYFPDKRSKVTVYQDALRSTKYQKGYEIKFGDQWKSLDWLVAPTEQRETYLPLGAATDAQSTPQGERGTLLIEYVYDGKSGIHKTKL